MTPNADYEAGWQAGYFAATKEIQRKFLPLWSAIQAAVGQSHSLDAFITEMRKGHVPLPQIDGSGT
jgi:hypothetical protein